MYILKQFANLTYLTNTRTAGTDGYRTIVCHVEVKMKFLFENKYPMKLNKLYQNKAINKIYKYKNISTLPR